MATEQNTQWPLTAAATEILLALPLSSAPKGGSAPDPKDAVKLALKELILRGAFRIQIEKRRLRKDKVTLLPGQASAPLPATLAQFDSALRPHTPDQVAKVVAAARRGNPKLIKEVGDLFLQELVGWGLVEAMHEKVLGLFSRTRYRRTASGDAWAASASQHVARLQALPDEAESQPQTAAQAAAVAGVLVLMVPAALSAIFRLRRRGRRFGGDLDLDFGYVGFDLFDGVGDMFDSALEGGLDGLDAGVDAVDSALDSVADSIDSGVDSGVDSGGGDGGGDGGGNGGGGD